MFLDIDAKHHPPQVLFERRILFWRRKDCEFTIPINHQPGPRRSQAESLIDRRLEVALRSLGVIGVQKKL